MRARARKSLKKATLMKVQCYAIFDSCSGIYEKPFFSTADDLVKREFQDVATSADHLIGKHPEHFTLWRLGIFNNENGQLQNETNEQLWSATEAIAQSHTVDSEQMDAFALKNSLDDPYNLPPIQAD